MKRTPLVRKTPMRRGSSQMKRTRLKPESDKRKAERPLRAEVRVETLRRAGHQCQARELVPEVACMGVPYTHEVAQRSVSPGSHLRVELTMAICGAHDDWLCRNIGQAHERGLLVHSWDVPRRR